MSQAVKRRKTLPQPPEEETIARKRSKTSNTSQDSQTYSRRAGTINCMILKNFMCHSLLEVDFLQNNISMVIGKNGSGKSALLTALIVGLGGKAAVSNRGTSVKSFIKVGKQSGSIELHLCNEGPMAYRPKIFGNTITIIRNFTASGSGSYRVKSEKGEVISTQAKEVLNITSSLNIQVDNPICLLTQDTARNFLSSSDPKKKFELFMKATKLEMLENEYRTILNNKNHCIKTLTEKKNYFAKLQEEIRRLKGKIDGHQSIVTLKENKLILQNELLWAQVRDVEEELAEEQKNVEKIVKKLQTFEENSNQNVQEIEEIAQKISEFERQKLELKDQLEIQKGPQADAKYELEELQNRYNELKIKKQGLNIEITSKTKDAEYLQQEIANANENMSKAEQQKKERLNNLSRLQEKITGVNDLLETTRNELFQIQNDIARKQENEESLQGEIRQVEHQIAREESHLEALQSGSENSLIIYGHNIPKVKEMIQNCRNSFQHEPKGPLGSYIKLKDKKWDIAVEGYLGRGMLSAWTVDNQNDGKLLQQIFAKCFAGDYQPTIITSKFLNRKHDVRDNLVQAPRECVSLYDALVIDDPVVSNCIVDQMNVENILLIPDGEKAMALMSDRNKVPNNCKQGLTMKGDKYFPDPNYKTYASNYHKARFLQIDTKMHILHLQETISNIKTRKQAIQSQLQALRADIRNQETTRSELKDKIQKVTLAKQKIRRQYDELSNTADPEVHNINNLEYELQDINNTLASKQVELEQYTEKLRELRTKINEQEEKMQKLKKATKALEDRLWPLEEQIRESQSKQKQLSTNKDYDKQRLQAYQQKVNDARASLVLKQSLVASKTSNASKLGIRPAELRRVVQISNSIQEISSSIAQIETETDNIEMVSAQYQELVTKYESVANVMRALSSDIDELSDAVERRKKHYKLTENYFVTYMKHSFKRILEFRQFKGSLNIDIEQKKLDLIVMPQQGSQGLTTTSNLSGGERSFSTVAFLYALWQCMDFPFYFLDEFDVYMDKLNRSKVIEILLHHANSKPDLQFVFLTPQDVSFIKQNVTLLRLEDPERFQV